MSHDPAHVPAEVLRLARTYPRRWIVPAVLVAVVALAYALLRENTWEASQTLMVRDEATGVDRRRPGEFDRLEKMQIVQETILEIARSRGLLAEVLKRVGPVSGATAAWPAERDIERLRQAVKISPPKGAEFGRTEVFYLKVRDHDRLRAIALAGTLSHELQTRLKQLRHAKAQSMTDELARAAALAKTELREATARLTAVEKQVGSDLSELRVLEKSPSGDSDLRRKRIQLENELRQARQARRANVELRRLLVAARDDPGHLLATPNRLLESQPALRRLKDGLIDAQLGSAQLLGSMSQNHPVVRAALEAEAGIARHLHDELDIALRGIDVDLRLTGARVEFLADQLHNVDGRLERLAAVRAEYGGLTDEIAHRTRVLQEAQTSLADARGLQAASNTASLVSRIDSPATGSSPLGPSRLAIVALGVVAGVAVGFGVLLVWPQATRTVEPVESVEHFSPQIQSAPAPVHIAEPGFMLSSALKTFATRHHGTSGPR